MTVPWPNPLRSALCLVMLTGGMFVGCNTSEARSYRILSFFFDGVPSPGTSRVDDVQPTVNIRQGQRKPRKAPAEPVYKVVAHKQLKCTMCHLLSQGMALRQERDKLCVTCHDQSFHDRGFVHGPVVIGQCGACHSAHRSKHPAATLKPLNALCLECHTQPDLMEGAHHRDAQSQICTVCHDPHGADNRFFLRPRETVTTQPVTQPATQPATRPVDTE